MITPINALPHLSFESVALARIKCTFSAYGNYPNIARFFKQEKGNGEIVSLISMFEGNVTVWSVAPNEELKSFLLTLCPLTVFADEPCAVTLEIKGERLCAAIIKGRQGKSEHSFDTNTLYEQFKEEFSIERLPFIADASHRLRHKAAVCVTREFGAAFMQQGENIGYITGIVVSPNNRLEGQGSLLLKKLITCEKEMQIFSCFKKELLPFYIKNNFKEITPCVIGSI